MKKKDFAEAGALYFIATLFNKGIGFVTVPIFSRILTTSDYGTVTTFNSWVSMISVFISLALYNAVRNSFVDMDDKERPHFLSTIITFTGLVFLTVMGVCVVATVFVPRNINTALIFMCIIQSFKAVHEYLVNGGKSCMAGFILKNILSDNGGVTRGICKMDENGNLTEVVETKNIVKTAVGAEADGVVVDVNSLVSMNMWGLTPDFLDVLENGFKEFFEKEVPSNPQKAEYLIPIFIGELLEQGKMSVKVLKTNDTWYGMTYHEDVAAVKDSFKKMLEKGVYKADLFSDL